MTMPDDGFILEPLDGPGISERDAYAFLAGIDGSTSEAPLPTVASAGNPMHVLASDRGLRNYWTRGKGAAKIRWGTDGSFARCVRQLGKHVRNPQGLCAEYHKEATGEWPAEKGVESAMTAAVVEKVDVDQDQISANEPWDGVLTVEGIESGDGRMFALGGLDWADLPLPLMYQPANVGGHNASIMVGEITQASRRANVIRGRGEIFGEMLDSEHGPGIRAMMKTGGVSVDVDDVKDADVELIYADSEDDGKGFVMSKPEMTIYHRGRIRGATLVAFPAFVEAKLNFSNQADDDASVTASVDCGCRVPLEGEDIFVAAADGESHTITIPNLPPAEWFQKPTDVKMHGALTITDEGRVYGWLGPAYTTHRSVNRQIPMGGRVDYSRWMKGETIVAGGGRVVTGVITGECGHAPTEGYGTFANRKNHYDNSCSAFANVVIGEEPGEGVWVAGALRHGVTGEQVAQALGCSLSGDWQPHPDRPGISEFIAALLVPVPGFPMARTKASVEMRDGALVASTVPVRMAIDGDDAPDVELVARRALQTAKRMTMSSLGLDPRSRKSAIMRELEGR